jgi:anti-sigma factor RsiW
MTMHAHPHREDVMAWLDGELEARRDAEVREHLSACSTCQALADELRLVSERLSAWEVDAAPSTLRAPQMPGTAAETDKPRRAFAWFTQLHWQIAALVVVGVAAAFWATTQFRSDKTGEVSLNTPAQTSAPAGAASPTELPAAEPRAVASDRTQSTSQGGGGFTQPGAIGRARPQPSEPTSAPPPSVPRPTEQLADQLPRTPVTVAPPQQGQLGQARASLSGVVTDSGGGLIPGATVVVRNDATGGAFNVVSSGAGVFSVPGLNRGTYTVTISLAGFKTLVLSDVVVAASPASVKAALEVGDVAETVTVTAASSVVDARTVAAGDVARGVAGGVAGGAAGGTAAVGGTGAGGRGGGGAGRGGAAGGRGGQTAAPPPATAPPPPPPPPARPAPASRPVTLDGVSAGVLTETVMVQQVLLARTAAMRIVVPDIEQARGTLERYLTANGGLVSRLNLTGERPQPRTLDATVKVPVGRLADAILAFRSLGRVQSESQGSEDVTAQSIDLDARLTNARRTELRLATLIQQRTGSVREVLEAEKEIARVRGEIERMEAERAQLTSRVDMATIELRLVEERRAELAPETTSVWRDLGNALRDGLRTSAEFGLGVVMLFLRVGPTILLCATAIGLPMTLWRHRRRADC